jgi:hypothetical protein
MGKNRLFQLGSANSKELNRIGLIEYQMDEGDAMGIKFRRIGILSKLEL